MSGRLRYASGTASERAIREHLIACSHAFIPPLQDRVDVAGYARKLAQRAICVEAWQGEVLAGLVAAYVDEAGDTCFVTNVSVLPSFAGMGVATRLLQRLLRERAGTRVSRVRLEVAKRNGPAVRLYGKLGFTVSEEAGDRVFMQLELPAASSVREEPR